MGSDIFLSLALNLKHFLQQQSKSNWFQFQNIPSAGHSIGVSLEINSIMLNVA